jgi:hypothetical protein
MWKRIAVILAIIIVAFLAVTLSLPLIIPTNRDAEVSNTICKSFEVEAMTVVTNKEISIVGSPQRGATYLLVSGSLSDSEKKILQQLADKIGQTNGNRLVQVFFK